MSHNVKHNSGGTWGAGCLRTCQMTVITVLIFAAEYIAGAPLLGGINQSNAKRAARSVLFASLFRAVYSKILTTKT
jgi:hypothetical protein